MNEWRAANNNEHDMLLKSAANTNSTVKQQQQQHAEEISTPETAAADHDHNNDLPLSSPAADEPRVISSVADDSPPPQLDGSRDSSQVGGGDHERAAGAMTTPPTTEPAPAQLTQLSVPPEEDSAFKNYLDAQDELMSAASQNATATAAADGRISSDAAAAPASRRSSSSFQSADENESSSELRLLVRRREAGAIIGKKGANIKRLRDTFKSSVFSIPDTGNGPERVVCITTRQQKSTDPILSDITQLLLEKSPENDEQVELKLLIHSSHAGSIIGIGGQSIKKLRNESKAAIKIYEMCCPLSNERVCAIKARPPIVVSTIKLIQLILQENPTKGTIKPYDALHFDLSLVDKYGGYLPEEPIDLFANNAHAYATAAAAFANKSAFNNQRYSLNNHWQSNADQCDPCEMQAQDAGHPHHRMAKRDPQQASKCPADAGSQQDEPIMCRSKFMMHRQLQLQHHQPANNRSARFHPYAAAANQQADCHQVSPSTYASRRSSNPHRYPAASSGQLHYPSADFPAAAAAALIAAAAASTAAAAGGQPRAPYAQLSGNHFGGQRAGCHQSSNQFGLFRSGGGTDGGGCRHLRPCLCMFLPMMRELPPEQSAAMLAAYAQAIPLDAGEEFNPSAASFHRPAANEQQQQRREASSPNCSSGGNNKK